MNVALLQYLRDENTLFLFLGVPCVTTWSFLREKIWNWLLEGPQSKIRRVQFWARDLSVSAYYSLGHLWQSRTAAGEAKRHGGPATRSERREEQQQDDRWRGRRRRRGFRWGIFPSMLGTFWFVFSLFGTFQFIWWIDGTLPGEVGSSASTVEKLWGGGNKRHGGRVWCDSRGRADRGYLSW